ncbi:hypothetical protein L1987_23504 [Smallanthus sonchifolius]|uniref:Uncharacterized protein n=1 Tax=Smallanthus sonchifolius TaxID=185202 RepID=A0ACB9II35_9ASTR|nr:hypothetical protein L1987_23504 [Smallanthus sonchifolius]
MPVVAAVPEDGALVGVWMVLTATGGGDCGETTIEEANQTAARSSGGVRAPTDPSMRWWWLSVTETTAASTVGAPPVEI